MDLLPDVILDKILRLCTAHSSDWPSPLNRIQLRQVCKRWHATLLDVYKLEMFVRDGTEGEVCRFEFCESCHVWCTNPFSRECASAEQVLQSSLFDYVEKVCLANHELFYAEAINALCEKRGRSIGMWLLISNTKSTQFGTFDNFIQRFGSFSKAFPRIQIIKLKLGGEGKNAIECDLAAKLSNFLAEGNTSVHELTMNVVSLQRTEISWDSVRRFDNIHEIPGADLTALSLRLPNLTHAALRLPEQTAIDLRPLANCIKLHSLALTYRVSEKNSHAWMNEELYSHPFPQSLREFSLAVSACRSCFALPQSLLAQLPSVLEQISLTFGLLNSFLNQFFHLLSTTTHFANLTVISLSGNLTAANLFLLLEISERRLPLLSELNLHHQVTRETANGFGFNSLNVLLDFIQHLPRALHKVTLVGIVDIQTFLHLDYAALLKELFIQEDEARQSFIQQRQHFQFTIIDLIQSLQARTNLHIAKLTITTSFLEECRDMIAEIYEDNMARCQQLGITSVSRQTVQCSELSKESKEISLISWKKTREDTHSHEMASVEIEVCSANPPWRSK